MDACDVRPILLGWDAYDRALAELVPLVHVVLVDGAVWRATCELYCRGVAGKGREVEDVGLVAALRGSLVGVEPANGGLDVVSFTCSGSTDRDGLIAAVAAEVRVGADRLRHASSRFHPRLWFATSVFQLCCSSDLDGAALRGPCSTCGWPSRPPGSVYVPRTMEVT